MLLQALQHEINGLEEQCHGREHLALGGVGEHALLDAIFRAKVCVKVYLCFLEELEVGADDDSWIPPRSALRSGVAIVGLTLELLGAQIEAEELVSHYRDVYEVLRKKEN